jgi:hypothetical protein
VDFSDHSLHICHIENPFFFQDFDGHLLARQHVDAQLHLAEGAATDGLV